MSASVQKPLLSIKTRRWLWISLYAACVLSLIMEFFIPQDLHGEHSEHHFMVFRHGHFEGGIDHYAFFFAGLGFLSCVVAIVLAKIVGKWLKVREDYYDD